MSTIRTCGPQGQPCRSGCDIDCHYNCGEVPQLPRTFEPDFGITHCPKPKKRKPRLLLVFLVLLAGVITAGALPRFFN